MNVRKSIASALVVGSLGLGFIASSSVANINNTSQASTMYLLNHHANSQTTKRVTFNKGNHLGINITAKKGGTYTVKVFRNGVAYKTYRGSGRQAHSFKVTSKAGYSVRAYHNVKGQDFNGGMTKS